LCKASSANSDFSGIYGKNPDGIGVTGTNPGGRALSVAPCGTDRAKNAKPGVSRAVNLRVSLHVFPDADTSVAISRKYYALFGNFIFCLD
jgi:hypothetical protein